MRRAVKEQILGIMDIISTASDDIAKGKLEGNQLLDTLSQCQDGAVAVGSVIEEDLGEGTEIVGRLEKFCELLYQAAQETGRPERVRKLGKVMRGKSSDIQNQIKNDIKEKLEVVFLPYKASMWDSLESIWRAACEDPDCEPYVIPIPYYDKNHDGSFGVLHYEIDEFPDEVPVMSYHNYDLENRRPDMIYIHNPYDECNLVTSVHPSFYSSKLKKYTDMLVYVPYFLGIADKVAAHHGVSPGTIYADKVIVESEAVRKIYMDEFSKYCKANQLNITSADIESKFLALGSPKLDKVRSSKREGFTLPEEWARILGDKKSVLYNTSLGTLLDFDELYLEKLKYVLGQFEERKDVVLWWRPHPLSEATVEVMRPELVAQYEKIVDEYRLKGTGIYDDTADLHRAIAMTDAYYGDWSSLVTMYRATGKPVMIQNVEVLDYQYCIHHVGLQLFLD